MGSKKVKKLKQELRRMEKMATMRTEIVGNDVIRYRDEELSAAEQSAHDAAIPALDEMRRMTPDQSSNDGSILAEAERLVGGDRLKFYGPPQENFKRIAEMWSAYLGVPVNELDVCCMMIALKVARIRTGGAYHRDSAVDAAGYARLLEILGEER